MTTRSEFDYLNQQDDISTHARAFVEVVRGMGLAGTMAGLPIAHLQERLGTGHPFVVSAQKAAVAAFTTTTDPSLALARLGKPFLDTFRASSILGQFRGVLSVPPNVPAPFASGGTPATWVAEGAAIPVTRFDVDNAAVPVGNIAVIGAFSQRIVSGCRRPCYQCDRTPPAIPGAARRKHGGALKRSGRLR